MSRYFRKSGEVEANQFFWGRPMIPGVIYPADRSEGTGKSRAYIFIDDDDNTQTLQPGDWVIQEDDEEGNMNFYVIKPEAFDLLFEKAEEAEETQAQVWQKLYEAQLLINPMMTLRELEKIVRGKL